MPVDVVALELADGPTALVVRDGPTLAATEVWLNSPAVVLRNEARPGDAPTVGSQDWLWAGDEEWRFDAAVDGRLVSVQLNVPEVNLDGDVSEGWNDASTLVGTLQLLVPKDFSRPETAVRWCGADGGELIGLYAAGPVPAGERWRLRIADGTYLLFVGGRLFGWSVADPARYVTGDAVRDRNRGTDVEPILGRLLAEYFALVTEEGVDRLEDGDDGLRQDLRRLGDQLGDLGARGESRATEIQVKVEQVLRDFG